MNNKDVHIRKRLGKLLRSRDIKLKVAKRRRKNSLVKIIGKSSIGFCLLLLLYIMFNIFSNCYYALIGVEVLIPITFTESNLSNSRLIIKEGIRQIIIDKDNNNTAGSNVVGNSSSWLVDNFIHDNNAKVGQKVELWLPASNQLSYAVKRGNNSEVINKLRAERRIRKTFNTNLFTHADSQHREYAGMLGSAIGTLLTVSICFVFALPLGILTGIYLEEFKFKNKILSSVIEISINNLSAIPAIIFGIVGLYFYITLLGLPRSSALVGGLVLSLMMLPVLIISTREALSTIPKGIKEAAFALGASKMQVLFHHSLPIAFPGIITGAVMAIARVVSESAPLLIIGMAAFIADVPRNMLEPATVFPLQIYMWASNPNSSFAELNSVLMLVLIVVLLVLNITADVISKKTRVKDM